MHGNVEIHREKEDRNEHTGELGKRIAKHELTSDHGRTHILLNYNAKNVLIFICSIHSVVL